MQVFETSILAGIRMKNRILRFAGSVIHNFSYFQMIINEICLLTFKRIRRTKKYILTGHRQEVNH
jgi:hypothetical protein